MIKKILLMLLVLTALNLKAQNKVDVIVFGASASGTAAAIQAARSGVKVILIEPTANIIGNQDPKMNILAFNSGIWKEWKDGYQLNNDTLHKNKELKITSIDNLPFFKNISSKIDYRETLARIVKSVKNLQYFKSTEVVGIEEKKNGWEVNIKVNGEVQEIKAKLLVDATDLPTESPLFKFGILNFSENGKIKSLISYTPDQQKQPYLQTNKLYRTSIAAGFNKDSSQVYAIPAGIFIPKEKDNLLVISKQASFQGIDASEFNLALQISIGQGAGGLAAFGPFFKTSPKNANVRILQSEVFNYKGQILPIKDVSEQDSSYKAIQQIIISGLLKLDFEKGLFYPSTLVNAEELRPIMTELYSRSKLWYLENKASSTITVESSISLISFISGREIIDINRELSNKWNKKYGFSNKFDLKTQLTRKEFAVIINDYLKPYTIRVDFNGNFVR
jgi:hypothetical protein